jgi:hypothetical protein
VFKRNTVHPLSDPYCDKPIAELEPEDFLYYDKDGFELNRAEQKFYQAMDYPIDHPILNHCCWQEPWFELEPGDHELILDHCMFLQRCYYRGAANKQIFDMCAKTAKAQLLLQTRPKWGYDFDLDALSPEGTVYEVLHIEIDDKNYERFINHMVSFDYIIRNTDWVDAAEKIWNIRDQWQHLKGFQQNDLKAKYLLGWNHAEYTEKAV